MSRKSRRRHHHPSKRGGGKRGGGNGGGTKRHVFSKIHYQSRDGMLTSTWGPAAWHFLHTISFNYPVEPTDDEKRNYRDYVLSLVHVLPCRYCRENLVKNLAKLPLEMKHMESRATFSKYIYELHELVNAMLGKKSGLSYEDVRDRYEHFRARCSSGSGRGRSKKGGGRGSHRKTQKKEKGCTEPIVRGQKSRCIIKIVPMSAKCPSFQMDRKCIKKVLSGGAGADNTEQPVTLENP